MKTQDLSRLIIDSGLPFDLVNFENEFPNESYCLRKNKMDKWEVYYSENDLKKNQRTFESESAACEYLWNKIKPKST